MIDKSKINGTDTIYVDRTSENVIMSDSVSHPSHYTYGKIECVDFILDKNLDFSLGNAIKYIVRAGHKSDAILSTQEKAIEDLEKAIKYIEFEIEHLKGIR